MRGTPGGYPPEGGLEEALVRVGGWVLAALAVTLVATAAVAVASAAYGVATWKRWRWWPLALAGLAVGLIAVAALGGPAGAWDHHTLALRELTNPAGTQPVGALIAARWAAWLTAQVPLSVPAGLVIAALCRHQVTHLPAHELAPAAQQRRAREDTATQTRAARRATNAPLEAAGAGVLGAWVGGDLDGWRHGPWTTIPDPALGLGTLLVGLPGAGKTETLLRLAQLGLARGWDVHVIDAKGDPATAQRFAALAQAAGVTARRFPTEPYDGWRGDPPALRNRLARIVDYTEPYYQDGARVLLAAACAGPAGPPRSVGQLLSALAKTSVEDLDAAVRKGTLSRYRSFAAAVGTDLDGTWAFEDTRASYLLLDGLALGDDAPRLARYLVEDFAHFASSRKPPERKVLLLIDEFSALRLPGAAALLERLRSFGAGVLIAAQSIEGLHDDPAERDRLINAASTLIAHRLADPDPIVTRAGTVRRAERSHQLDGATATGTGSLRMQDTYRIDPNELRSLPPGIAYIVTNGRAAKTAVTRAPTTAAATQAPRPVAPAEPAPAETDHTPTERVSPFAQEL